LRDTLADNRHAISNALDVARHEVLFGTVGDYLPGVREALEDGSTPLQDFLNNLEARLEDPASVADGISTGIGDGSSHLSDFLSDLVGGLDTNVHDRLFASLEGRLASWLG
jgi:hypothetical protein